MHQRRYEDAGLDSAGEFACAKQERAVASMLLPIEGGHHDST
jgi:hypothetical protein